MFRKILFAIWMWWDDIKDDFCDLDVRRQIVSSKREHEDPIRSPSRPMKWRDFDPKTPLT